MRPELQPLANFIDRNFRTSGPRDCAMGLLADVDRLYARLERLEAQRGAGPATLSAGHGKPAVTAESLSRRMDALEARYRITSVPSRAERIRR